MKDKLLFLCDNVPDKNILLDIVNQNQVDIIEFNTSDDFSFNKNYKNIGFVWHNEFEYVPFGKGNYIINDYKFKYFKKDFVNYLSKYNDKIVVDLIACPFEEKIFVEEIKFLSNILENVLFQHSFIKINSYLDNDLKLGSNGICIKNKYFNEKINNYHFALGSRSSQFSMAINSKGDLYSTGDELYKAYEF